MGNDIELLNLIKKNFNCGTISKPRSNDMIHFTVSKLSDINNIIIPHFTNYPLRGNKLQDFNSWCLAANIITEGRHLTAEGIVELQDLFRIFISWVLKYNYVVSNSSLLFLRNII